MSAIEKNATKPHVDWRGVLRKNWRGTLTLVRASEWVNKRDTAAEIEQQEDEERSYRRGYWHGYSQAMDDMRACSKQEYSRVQECFNWLASFYDEHLTPWRNRGFRNPSHEQPPRFPLPPKWSAQRAAVKKKQEHCASCGQAGGLECDHIIPVSQGGRAEMDNLRMLCVSCHRERAIAKS